MKKNYYANKAGNSGKYFLTLFLMFFALSLMSAASQAAVSFVNISGFGENVYHGDLLIDDFNNDNIADLTATNHYVPYAGTDFISVLLGETGSTLPPITDYPGGQRPLKEVSGDFNNDGTVDIVTCNADKTLKIFAGNGDGTFMDYTTAVSIIDTCGMFSTADFNNDGNLDIAHTNYANYSVVPAVSIQLGNGNGTFTTYSSIWDTKASPTTIHAADFNHDSNIDLAVSYPWGGQIGIFPGNGDGTFGNMTLYNFRTWGLHKNNFSIEDINFDGSPDLVGLPLHTDGSANTLINDGFGLFSTVTWTNLSTISPEAMATADFNCDGRHDMAISGYDKTDSLRKLFIYTGNGDGTFEYDSKYDLYGVSFPSGGGRDLISTGDLNGDGMPDIAIKSSFKHLVNVLLNTTPATTGFCSVKPDIKANGSDGPLLINKGDLLDITLTLDPGTAAGVDADWWIYVLSPAIGSYWFKSGSWWIKSDTPIPAYQGPLVPLTDYNVLEISTLPAGDYDFYFEIDERNDIKEGARSDTVNVTIQ